MEQILHSQHKELFKHFDGFRHDYVNPKLTPNLYAIANAGVQGHMRSTFVTKTYPNHQSIATGLYEPFHGIINNNFYDPIIKEYFDVFNSSSIWWDQNNISVPIYVANQYYEPNRYSIAMQWPGSIANYTDGKNTNKRIRVHYLQDFNPKFDWYKQIDLLIKWLNDPLKPANCAFVYYTEPDSKAHQYGPFSKQVYEQIKNLDDIVGYFRKQLIKAGLAHRTNVIYLSDHGIAEVRANRSLFLNKCDKLFPRLKYLMIGSSPVYSILPLSGPFENQPKNKSLAKSVAEALNNCSFKYFNNKFKAMVQEEIPESFHYKNNVRILPVLVYAEEGYDINYEDKGWRPKGYPIWGNHGYNASLSSMRPLFLAQGPRFKRAYFHMTPFENIDLYPLMLNLLDIPLRLFPSNGSFERVHQMLTNQLYLNDEDILLQNDSSNTIWIRLFIYLIVGFLLIFITGGCFVFLAGLNKRSILLYRQTESKLNNYLNRIWNKRTDDSNYRMFANQRPVIHLDSSSEDEDGANELYRRNALPERNQLTNIDWNIIGTGLDIDLASQINDGKGLIKQSEREEYLYRKDSEKIDEAEFTEQSNKSGTTNGDSRKKEEESALLLINEYTDISSADEEIKTRINIEEYEAFIHENEKANSHNLSNKLIDI